jgi:hypothetical protein
MRALTLVAALVALAEPGMAQEWLNSSHVDKTTLGTQGNNPYFPLTPGSQWSYKKGNNTEVVTVLSETRIIDGVECRAVEDREEKNGQLIELTRDYFAIDRASHDVYYMGEDVDVYKNGKVVSHEGAWLSGVNGARFGMMMPGQPKTGQRFYQEEAPPSGMDRIEIKSTSAKVTTPAGTFENCVLVEETNPAEKGVKDSKWYARGVGPARDAGMLLVSYVTK